jgi:hypothetical protein
MKTIALQIGINSRLGHNRYTDIGRSGAFIVVQHAKGKHDAIILHGVLGIAV